MLIHMVCWGIAGLAAVQGAHAGPLGVLLALLVGYGMVCSTYWGLQLIVHLCPGPALVDPEPASTPSAVEVGFGVLGLAAIASWVLLQAYCSTRIPGVVIEWVQ